MKYVMNNVLNKHIYVRVIFLIQKSKRNQNIFNNYNIFLKKNVLHENFQHLYS